MACIAGLWYSIHAQTVYEVDLCVIVSMLTCSASLVLHFSVRGKMTPRQSVVRNMALFAGLLVAMITVARNHLVVAHQTSLKDFHCYGRLNKPHQFVVFAALFQSALWALIPVSWLVAFIWALTRPPNHSTNIWQNDDIIHKFLGFIRDLFYGLEGLFMWICLAFIIIVRKEAEIVYGRSYADNAMGYGQVIACGFCIQTVSQWTVCMICKFIR